MATEHHSGSIMMTVIAYHVLTSRKSSESFSAHVPRRFLGTVPIEDNERSKIIYIEDWDVLAVCQHP